MIIGGRGSGNDVVKEGCQLSDEVYMGEFAVIWHVLFDKTLYTTIINNNKYIYNKSKTLIYVFSNIHLY